MDSPTGDGYMDTAPSPEQTLPMVPRGHQVTKVAPAKKITFYKSGDPQFGGVKMAINHRSFKSFSALMDDLSNRVPLPFGVRTITTPRGTHSVNRLEQLVDGGSYICSDKKYVQPIAPSKPGHKMAVQRPGPPASARKQSRQDEHEDEYTATHFQQVPRVRKKITLVKNGDPTVRRSIILNRTNGRNLKTFLEEASDLLQYTVRRIYTVDGRRIESIQAVSQVPSLLICVGREPFKPIHLENARKSVAEKLPGLRSHPAVTSASMDNRKNANFGLKAKKSVIHPRTASSGKTRFSLSSEKSYPNDLNMSPMNSGYASSSKACPHTKSEDSSHSLVNEDIEKRVHVNKDGSLSVEMKVRFRLLNEETLQWSTQIKKSSNAGKAKCEQLSLCDEDETMTRKGLNPELFSETDESFYPCDGESYSSKPNYEELEDVCCAHCGLQCQEYDIWKNPMHVNQPQDYTSRGAWQTRSSVSSSSSHKRVICNQKTSIDSLHRTSSEEYTEHIVHRSSHYSETKEHGETRVTYSAVSQCTNCSGQSTAASNREINTEIGRKSTGERQRKSRSSSKTENSLLNETVLEDFKESVNMTSHSASIEEWSELSPTPSSSHEINNENCSQRISVLSQSPVRSSRSSHRKVKNRVSAETICGQSNLSLKMVERQESPSMSTPTNLLSISNVYNNCEEMCLSSSTAQLIECHRTSNDEIDSGQENGPVQHSARISLSDCEKCSTKSSCHSTHKKKRVSKNTSNKIDPPRSPCSSINPKENGSIHVHANNIPDQCEVASELQESCSSIRSETHEVKLQSQTSFQSVSSWTDSTSCHGQEGQPTTKIPVCDDNCSLGKPGDDIMSGPEEDRNTSLSNKSRSSSISQSASSRHNCVRYPKSGKSCSANSRVSSTCDKESKCTDSTDNSSANDRESQVSQQNTKQYIQNGNVSNKGSDCEHNSGFRPTPPKDKPNQRQRRSSALKYSCSSEYSDPAKIMNGENPVCSRSTSPASQGILADKVSKERKSSMKSNNSAEETSVRKKRKDSSSSSKRMFKKESLDSELHPSALPNVTSEEVVHEWLRKIPSRTIDVDYEVEECSTKISEETQTEDLQPETDKSAEEGDAEKDVVKEIQESCQVHKETTDEENCTNDINNIQDTNTCDEEQKEDILLPNRIKGNDDNSVITAVPLCDKIFPSTIHNSVQIMKALLRPLKESKFDRSNSLPEVSPSMGKRLSNSAKVLISCLASLQLLDEGTTDCMEESNISNKPKYNELLNILQDLWTKAPENKCLKNAKSGKQLSREDEVTPVSSSGVDVNSGYDGSGDGSITGGGDSTGIAEKADESKLSVTPSDNKTNDCQFTEITETTSGNLELENGQCAEKDTPALVRGPSAGLDEANTHLVDENMNEKMVEDNKSNMAESESTNDADNTNNVNEEITENMECMEQSNDTMNILSQTENSPESNESNTEECNGISSQSDVQSTIISTSDSNGKKDLEAQKQLNETDPIWALKLLRKIETEFMAHYVDAMNEFKVRWNLEDDENLEGMIAELKNDVGQRIQKSITNELKKIKSKAGQRMPRPPGDHSSLRSSLQAEERRQRLQTMHKRSAMQLANGDKNKDLGTNDTSCETDEENLTFSASLGNDANGLTDDDEFCPCETCIKKKRALKLAQPKVVISDAPITRAFDLQQILKMKKDNNLQLEECNSPKEEAVNENACSGGSDEEENKNGSGKEDSSSRLEKQDTNLSLSLSNDEKEADDINEGPSIVVENGERNDVPDADKGQDDETNNNESLDNETENEACSETGHAICKPMSREHSAKSESNEVSEEEQQSEQEHNNSDINEDDIDSAPAAEQEETKENVEDTSETEETEGTCLEEGSGHEKDADEEISVSSAEENCHLGILENGFNLQKSHMGQVSLITHQGSVDNPDEVANSTAETSPNGDLDSPDSKKTQMYPDSSSEEDNVSSGGTSPVDGYKNGTIEKGNVNLQGRTEESLNNLAKTTKEDIISEDEFDF